MVGWKLVPSVKFRLRTIMNEFITVYVRKYCNRLLDWSASNHPVKSPLCGGVYMVAETIFLLNTVTQVL